MVKKIFKEIQRYRVCRQCGTSFPVTDMVIAFDDIFCSFHCSNKYKGVFDITVLQPTKHLSLDEAIQHMEEESFWRYGEELKSKLTDITQFLKELKDIKNKIEGDVLDA